MPTHRDLILPDGGKIKLEIPAEFGAPVFALSDASPLSKKSLLKVGLGLMAVGALVWMYARWK